MSKKKNVKKTKKIDENLDIKEEKTQVESKNRNKKEKVEMAKEDKKKARNNNQPKRKKTAYEKRKIFMKIAGWIMALVMIFGTLISIFGMLIYR